VHSIGVFFAAERLRALLPGITLIAVRRIRSRVRRIMVKLRSFVVMHRQSPVAAHVIGVGLAIARFGLVKFFAELRIAFFRASGPTDVCVSTDICPFLAPRRIVIGVIVAGDRRPLGAHVIGVFFARERFRRLTAPVGFTGVLCLLRLGLFRPLLARLVRPFGTGSAVGTGVGAFGISELVDSHS
jgi:hypothetical protein